MLFQVNVNQVQNGKANIRHAAILSNRANLCNVLCLYKRFKKPAHDTPRDTGEDCWYNSLVMDKTITIIRHDDSRNSGYVAGTKEERIAMVWPLTCELVSLSKKYDVKQPLQRHIVNIVRKKS